MLDHYKLSSTALDVCGQDPLHRYDDILEQGSWSETEQKYNWKLILPYPNKWEESMNAIATSGLSESGQEFYIVTRKEKYAADCEFVVDERYARCFKLLAFAGILGLTFFDIHLGTEGVRSVKMKDFALSLVPKSGRLNSVTGLWNVAFKLEEM